MTGGSEPKASECMSTRTKLSLCRRRLDQLPSAALARLSSSAAFMLKKHGLTPVVLDIRLIACALGSVERMSRCTPKMSMPLRASSRAVAPPKPLEAPRITAQPLDSSSSASWLFNVTGLILGLFRLRPGRAVHAFCVDHLSSGTPCRRPPSRRARTALEHLARRDDAVAHALRRDPQRVLVLLPAVCRRVLRRPLMTSTPRGPSLASAMRFSMRSRRR